MSQNNSHNPDSPAAAAATRGGTHSRSHPAVLDTPSRQPQPGGQSLLYVAAAQPDRATFPSVTLDHR